MIYIDIHRKRLSKNWANICRFVLSPWGNYRELTVIHNLIRFGKVKFGLD